jgi:hypothetical protein
MTPPTLVTPGPNAPIAEWESWWTTFSPVSMFSEDDKFLYALGIGETSLSGAQTQWADRIKTASDDGKGGYDPTKQAAILATIEHENSARIVELEAAIPALQQQGLDAFNARMAKFNAANDAPLDAPGQESPHNSGAPVASPVVPAITPTVPAGHAPIDIPPQIAAKLPEGTIATSAPAGPVTIQVPHEGFIHRLEKDVAESWDALVRRIESVFGKKPAA